MTVHLDHTKAQRGDKKKKRRRKKKPSTVWVVHFVVQLFSSDCVPLTVNVKVKSCVSTL